MGQDSPAPAAAAWCTGLPHPPAQSPHRGSWSWLWVAGSVLTGSPSGGASPSAPVGEGSRQAYRGDGLTHLYPSPADQISRKQDAPVGVPVPQ